MLSKLFKNRTVNNKFPIFAPIDGEIIPLEEVPDPVFSEKIIGEGIAIHPIGSTITSPVDGTILQVFPTKHAIGIRDNNGIEILIHIGLDTVNLNGEGFTSYVQEGDKVVLGDKLISFDLEKIKEKRKDTIIPIIITNSDKFKEISSCEKSSVISQKDEILSLIADK
ncbi:PTS glucose transporter subunit IIA [Oceanobacillus caeni]